MKWLVAVLLLAGVPAWAGEPKLALPKGAVVIETQPVKKNRTLVLWMQNPTKHPRDAGDVYTCPEFSRGHYYEGPTRISLVAADSGQVINSVKITSEGEDVFDVPYLIERFYYQVPKPGAHKEGKPRILALQDINGDGQALEFAMFDQLACMGLQTALFGYSERQDRVIHYPVELTTEGKMTASGWADYLFSRKPVARGVWKYEIDYRGRGGTLDQYEVHYDRAGEKFVGTLSSIGG